MTKLLSKRVAYAFAAAVLAGCISAAIFEVALNHAGSVVVLILYTTAIPLFLAGLGAGTLAGVAASAAGFISLALREPSNYAVLYAFVYALPAVVVTMFALHKRMGADGKPVWMPEGYLLMTMALYPCAIFLFMAAIGSTHEGGLLLLTQDFVSEFADAVKKGMDAETATRMKPFFQFLSRYLPAVIGTSWMFITTLSLIIAQRVLQQHKLNIRPQFTLRNMRLPTWLINAVAITGLFGAFATDPYAYIGANLAMMLGLAFFFVGIAIAHAWANTRKAAALILCVFYVVLFLMPFLILLVALLGVLDQWADFRQRLIKQTKLT